MKKLIINILVITLLLFIGSSSHSFAASDQSPNVKTQPTKRTVKSASTYFSNPGGIEGIPGMQAPLYQQDKYSVSLFSGSATYSYPIKLPKGTNDLTPSLSLNYSHQAAHDPSGYVGSGWEIDYPYITTNTQFFPSNTSNFTYRLHFQGQTYDLVYVSGDSTYHTKIESHFKIQKIASGGQNNDGVYWTLTTTDGTVYRFGYATTSELPCSGQSYQYKWAADQVLDLHSNHIYYSYTQSNGQIYLTKISYNNDNAREADLNYITNPYQKQYAIEGCSIQEGNILSYIQVKANGNLVHEYDLAFTQAGNGQNLLQTITEKGSNGSSSLPPVTFSYNPENQSFNSSSVNYAQNDLGTQLSDSNTQMCDMTGTGLPYIVKSPSNTGGGVWNVHINYGDHFTAAWSGWGNISASLSDTGTRLMDVNGDGKCDVVQSKLVNGNEVWNVWLNDGNQFNGPYQWLSVNANNYDNLNISQPGTALIDINGDGLPDIVHMIGSNYEVLMNTGSGWSTTWTIWSTSNSIPDLSNSNLRLMDVNDDGLPDVVQSNDNGNCFVTWHVWKNTGNSFNSTSETWLNNAQVCVRNDRTDTTISDVNGDGLPDLIEEGNSGGGWTMKILLNTGSGWSTTFQSWLTSNLSQDFTDTKFVDVNGDGLPDVVFTPGTNAWYVYKNQGYAPESLANITSQQGGTIAYQYVPSTNFSNGGNLPFPLWVVSAKTLDNGMTNTQHTSDTTQYSYANGLYAYLLHEFRGFGQVNETDPNTAKKTYSFAQDDAVKGNLNEVDTNDSQNNPYAKTVNTWSNSQSNGVYTVNLTQEKSYTYDGTSSNPKISETDYQYDTYGNITKKSELGDTGTNSDDRFTYNVFTTSPSLWLVNALSDTYVNKSDDATKVSETWNYYDGNANLTDAPTKGDVTKQVKWLSGGTNPTTTYTYESYGNKTQETDANNHSTSWSYGTTDTTHTYPDSTTNAKTQTTSMTYDLGTGNLLSKTDPNGFATSYTYDVFGRVSKEIDPYDSSSYPTVNYTYYDNTTAPQGTLVSKRKVSGQSGTLDVYTFIDGLGRTLQSRAPAEDTTKQIVSETYYDPNGKVSKQSVPHLDTLATAYATPVSGIESTNTAYDPVTRVITITNPQGTTKSTSYDHWTQTNTDENGHQKKKYFDAFNNILQVDEHNSGFTYSTLYVYDAQNNLTSITDALNNNSTYTYDTLNRKITMVDPDMGTYHYQYDGVGNQTQQTDNRGRATNTTYDPLNRVASVSYPTDSTVTYTYDTNTKGTLAQVQDAAGTISYTYDNRLRKTQDQRVTDGITWTTSYAYDAADRLLSTTKPGGEVITNTFNAQGEVASASGILTNVDYNALDKVTGKTFANGLTTNYTYNTTDFRLNRIQTGTVQDVGYTYDNVGSVLGITDNLLSKTQTFGYDNLDRLISASESAGYNFSYTYDAIGNLTKYIGSGSTSNYAYGQSTLVHAISSQTTTTIIYDDTLASQWTDASFNATNGTTATSLNVYSGSVALVSALGASGGLDFQAPSGMTTSGSDTLHFALKASQAGQQYDVYIDSVFGQPLSNPVSLLNYGGQPIANGWTVYNIPLADLGATNVPLGDVVIHNANSTDEPAVYVDQVELSSGIPASLTSSLTDDWSSGNINAAKWNDTSSGAHTSVVSQQLNISTGTSPTYTDVKSVGNYDLTGSSVTNQLVNIGNQNIGSLDVYPIIAIKDGSNRLDWQVQSNTLAARKEISGSYSNVATTTYNASVHKFLRIRELGGTIYWDYSIDGTSWTNFTSLANPFAITSMQLSQEVGNWNTETTTTSVIFDNFNIIPPPATSSITDDWSSGSINTAKWDNWAGSQGSVVSSQLKITSTLAGGYYGLDSAVNGASYDLTGSYVTNQLIDAGNQNIASLQVFPITVVLNSNTNYALFFFVSNNVVHAQKAINGTYTDVRTATYNSSTHKYFRIRELGGTTYWDTSTNGTTWTNFTSAANPFALNSVRVGMSIGTWNTEASTTTATFDNFNILPITPLTSSVIDDWSSGSISSTKWSNWGGSQASVVNNQMQITSTLAGGYYGVDSGINGKVYDLTGSSVTNKLINAGNQTLTSWEAYPLTVNKDSNTSYGLFFFVSGNTLFARNTTPSGYTNVRTATYNSSTHKYFRIRESSGIIYWDTSTDGSTWTNFTSTADPFDITAVRVGMSVGTWNAEASTTSATFDNFNIVP